MSNIRYTLEKNSTIIVNSQKKLFLFTKHLSIIRIYEIKWWTSYLHGKISLYLFFLRLTSFSPSLQEYIGRPFRLSLINFSSWNSLSYWSSPSFFLFSKVSTWFKKFCNIVLSGARSPLLLDFMIKLWNKRNICKLKIQKGTVVFLFTCRVDSASTVNRWANQESSEFRSWIGRGGRRSDVNKIT